MSSLVPRESTPYQVQYVWWNRNAISLHLRANRNIHFAWVPSPNLGEGVELEGRVCDPLKVLCSRYNSFAGTETLSLSVYEPIAIHILVGGTVPPIWGKGVKLGGRVRYPVKAHHTGHNLLIETDTLSLFV